VRSFVALGTLIFVGLGAWFLQPAAADLVVYCAHDSLYAEPYLRQFTSDTGITVQVRYDTERTKSLGLTELIAKEREHPRCDVFWSNEALGAVRLADADLLVPYKGSGYQRIPARYKDPQGRWVGFAGRLRVWILPESPTDAEAAIAAGIGAQSLRDFAIAKPLYGTTRSHLTALWELLGPEGVRRWHADLRRRHARVVAGNATVKNLVAAGTCALGWTDTDDYFVARDAQLPVRMRAVRLPQEHTLCIPNTAAIVAGCKNIPAARILVDYLAAARSEVALARSRSRQIPLGPVDPQALPEEVRELVTLAQQSYVFRDMATSSRQCLAWLKTEYLK